LLRADVLEKAIESTKTHEKNEKVILLDPQGTVFKQEVAENLSELTHIILVCGHYEGFDERIRKFVDLEISLGDFVLTGGEIPAMAIIDSITRLIPGVLKDETATKNESHSKIDEKRILEAPHYTRPEEFKGMKVPEVFLSGNPKKIKEYEKEKAIQTTRLKRPDLLESTD
jgi:tRNA (guanine37-N1)-methyltransferase